MLFDGTSADKFDNPSHLNAKLKTLDSGVTTKDKFGDYTLHLEFRLSYMPEARGQGRSNSGVYIHDCYEMQVLDSFGLKGENNECGGFYTMKAPDVNMCLPPLAWQTYDIDFTAPKYEGGKKVANARITREAQRRGDPQGLGVARRHARPPGGRPRPAADPPARARQPRPVSEHLVGGEEVASGLVRRKHQLARLVSDVSVSTMK